MPTDWEKAIRKIPYKLFTTGKVKNQLNFIKKYPAEIVFWTIFFHGK